MLGFGISVSGAEFEGLLAAFRQRPQYSGKALSPAAKKGLGFRDLLNVYSVATGGP